MTALADFKSFGSEISVDKALRLALRYFAAAHLLACPSERAISTLNRIVTTLHSNMTRKAIRMHLIGAEDLCDVGYPYDAMETAWGAVRRQRCQHKVRKLRKGQATKYKKEARTLPKDAPFSNTVDQCLPMFAGESHRF